MGDSIASAIATPSLARSIASLLRDVRSNRELIWPVWVAVSDCSEAMLAVLAATEALVAIPVVRPSVPLASAVTTEISPVWLAVLVPRPAMTT